jgi:hypothetical protein
MCRAVRLAVRIGYCSKQLTVRLGVLHQTHAWVFSSTAISITTNSSKQSAQLLKELAVFRIAVRKRTATTTATTDVTITASEHCNTTIAIDATDVIHYNSAGRSAARARQQLSRGYKIWCTCINS